MKQTRLPINPRYLALMLGLGVNPHTQQHVQNEHQQHEDLTLFERLEHSDTRPSQLIYRWVPGWGARWQFR